MAINPVASCPMLVHFTGDGCPKDDAEAISDFCLYLLRIGCGQQVEHSIPADGPLNVAFTPQESTYFIVQVLAFLSAVTVLSLLTLIGMIAYLFTESHDHNCANWQKWTDFSWLNTNAIAHPDTVPDLQNRLKAAMKDPDCLKWMIKHGISKTGDGTLFEKEFFNGLELTGDQNVARSFLIEDASEELFGTALTQLAIRNKVEDVCVLFVDISQTERHASPAATAKEACARRYLSMPAQMELLKAMTRHMLDFVDGKDAFFSLLRIRPESFADSIVYFVDQASDHSITQLEELFTTVQDKPEYVTAMFDALINKLGRLDAKQVNEIKTCIAALEFMHTEIPRQRQNLIVAEKTAKYMNLNSVQLTEKVQQNCPEFVKTLQTFLAKTQGVN